MNLKVSKIPNAALLILLIEERETFSGSLKNGRWGEHTRDYYIMINKVTNIYIDTTDFCDDVIERVQKAFEVIIEHNGAEEECPNISDIDATVIGFNENGVWCNFQDANDRQVGVCELESIASQCKGGVDEPLPTRNICIDARTLTKEQRRDAFAVISSLSPFSTDWYVPPNGDSRTMRDADFILYDIFAIDKDGDRVFIDNEINQSAAPFLVNPKELTYWELMSLVHT